MSREHQWGKAGPLTGLATMLCIVFLKMGGYKNMPIKPPFTEVEVKTSPKGFYEGHSLEIALLSKTIMIALVIWALVWPGNANST